MEIIDMQWHRKNHTLEFHHLNTQTLIHILHEDSLKVLSSYLGVLPLTDYVLVPFNRPMIECYQKVRPYIEVIIRPSEVKNYIKRVVGEESWAYMQEVAVAGRGDYENQPIVDLFCFIENFYASNSVNEAVEKYEHWQEYIPTNQRVFEYIIRLMEYNYKEIFQFFTVKQQIEQQVKAYHFVE